MSYRTYNLNEENKDEDMAECTKEEIIFVNNINNQLII